MQGIYKRIQNDATVASSATNDKYNKGAAVLHMIRKMVGDTTFRQLLLAINKKFYHQNVNTKEMLSFISQFCKKDFSSFFRQYIYDTRMPALEYFIKDQQLWYHWSNCVTSFTMPVKVKPGNTSIQSVTPKTIWQSMKVEKNAGDSLHTDKKFYYTAHWVLADIGILQ